MTLKTKNVTAVAMTTAAPLSIEQAQTISDLVLGGDLSKMDPQARVRYYVQLCESLRLNPLTQPFLILKLQGKEILYATKSCTEQLRKLWGVSVTNIEARQEGSVYLVVAYVQDSEGRTDAASGVVALTDQRGNTLTGENLANAFMKAETKAKRRATLSLCGLGMLEESELDTLPQATKVSLPAAPELGTSATEVIEQPAPKVATESPLMEIVSEESEDILEHYREGFATAQTKEEILELWNELSFKQKQHMVEVKDSAKARVGQLAPKAALANVLKSTAGTVPVKVSTVTTGKEQPLRDAAGAAVVYATLEQKDEIMGLIQHPLITRKEKTLMISGILKVTAAGAPDTIANLRKAISDRENGESEAVAA